MGKEPSSSRALAARSAHEIAESFGLHPQYAACFESAEIRNASPALTFPDEDDIAALLFRLSVKPEDANEILQSIPDAKSRPEVWRLLEFSHGLLVKSLANRDTALSASSGFRPHPVPDWVQWLQSSEHPLPPALRLFPVHLLLSAIANIRGCHREFGIPDDISWSTLSVFGRAMSEYRQANGRAGIQLSRWNWLRFLGWLFEVGRLEVTPYRIRRHPPEAGPLFWYDEARMEKLGPGFRTGDPALGIHIPANEPLAEDAVEASLHRMRSELLNIYAGEPIRVATCTSWLLDEQLVEYLPQDSNIVSFQQRFQLVPGARQDDNAVLRNVFGCDPPTVLDSLPQETSLARAIVHHLNQGRHWFVRTGWLSLS